MNKLTEYLKGERGRLTKLAAFLDITPGAISQWNTVPSDKLLAIEEHTKIPRQQLRPDLFEGMRAQA